MNSTDFNNILNAAISQAITEGVNKKQIRLAEMIGILEIHQQNLVGLNMQRQFTSAQIQAATAQVMQNLPPAPEEGK
jgi:hypothetical protein